MADEGVIEIPNGDGISDDVAGGEAPEYFVGEMTADDVVERLGRVNDFGNSLKGLESRAFGKMGSLEETVRKLQTSLPTQAKFDATKLTRIAQHDPDLAKAIAEDLSEALQLFSVSEESVAPFIQKHVNQLSDRFNQDVVAATHHDVNDFVPDDWENPSNQRQKDYVKWYEQASWENQQALLNRGVGAVKALHVFKDWERKLNEDRKAEADRKKGRLEGGLQPAADRGRTSGRKIVTEEEAFNSVFN